ncbi:cytochrome b5-like isoform X1 [Cucurbita moschata]|uniref:Cytochrome b5-like isoform X1 n=1 Tax=Cucurbita moschata TaxID=3662 RepID=A0A6J1E7V2_CUCMO|nr:cytochrome b5-like isoform X1 [Cucurbita moschata]
MIFDAESGTNLHSGFAANNRDPNNSLPRQPFSLLLNGFGSEGSSVRRSGKAQQNQRLLACNLWEGKDATNDFEDVGHSDSAREMMDKYYIGEIDPSTVPLRKIYIPSQQTQYNPDKTAEFVIKILQILVPIFILGLAFAVRHYTKNE